MPNISNNLQRLAVAKTNIANAITTRGGVVNEGDGFENFAADILTIPTGGEVDNRKDVNFYDYEGTILYTYTKEEFLNLSEMPSNPNHTDIGLVSQGWNWDFEEAYNYVRKYGKLEIGQLYDTNDECLWIFSTETNSFTLHMSIEAYSNCTCTATIYWGDNSSDTFSVSGTSSASKTQRNSYTHTYNSENFYIIKINIIHQNTSTGATASQGNKRIIYSFYSNYVDTSYDKIIGVFNSSKSPISDFKSLHYVPNLQFVTNGKFEGYLATDTYDRQIVPHFSQIKHLTFGYRIYNGAFRTYSINCSGNHLLKSISIPSSCIPIHSAFSGCISLKRITLNLPPEDTGTARTTGKSLFQGCVHLQYLVLANNRLGKYAFAGCYNIKEIVFMSSTISGEFRLPYYGSTSSPENRVYQYCTFYNPESSATSSYGYSIGDTNTASSTMFSFDGDTNGLLIKIPQGSYSNYSTLINFLIQICSCTVTYEEYDNT